MIVQVARILDLIIRLCYSLYVATLKRRGINDNKKQ